MPITEINQLPSRNNPETFAVDTEVTFDQLSQAIRDINDLGSIINTQITGTSTTSLTIGTGSKSLTVQTGLSLVPGYPVRIAYTTTPTDNMDGTVTTYNISTGALVVNVASVNGSGTYANWQVMLLPSATGNFADKSTANTFTDIQTFTGGVAANPLIKKQSDPTLGGALLLEKSSGSSLSGNVKFELSGNSIRIYENGGTSRGLTIDLTTLDASIASQLITSALKSTQAIAEGMADDTYFMTSLKTKQQIDARVFTSSQQSMTAGGLITVAHGLGAEPKNVILKLICTTADSVYSVGDKFTIATGVSEASSQSAGVTVRQDATNVYVRIGSGGLILVNNSGTVYNITLSNYRMIVIAEL